MKKMFFGFILLFVFAIFLSGCSSGQAGESSSLAGESTALLRSVNANSCNADSSCEMASGAITGNLTAKGNVFLGKNTQSALFAEIKNASTTNPASFNLYEKGVNFGITLLPPTLADSSGSVKISSDKGLGISAYNIGFESIKPISFTSPLNDSSFVISNQPASSTFPARTELFSNAEVLQIGNMNGIEIGADNVTFQQELLNPLGSPGASKPTWFTSWFFA